MNYFQNVFATFLLLFFALTGEAQILNFDQNPPNVKWNQIKTESFQIIFPVNFELEAQRVANTLEAIKKVDVPKNGKQPKPISIILQNKNAISNGFVALAPRRSEFFTTPPPDNDANDWIQNLSIHEYRHVVQFNQMNTGITKMMSVLFGQNAQSAVMNIYFPPWFFEGDATLMETVHSRAGRGRQPLWYAEMRANTLDIGSFSYQKSSFGSYKNNVPDRYVLGYHMVGYARSKFGATVWDKAITETTSGRRVFYSFTRALKSQTGYKTKGMYLLTMADLRKKWNEIDDQIDLTNHKAVLNEQPSIFTDYEYAFENGKSIVAIKSGMADAPQLVSIIAQEETTLKKLGFQASRHLHVANNKAVWHEFNFHPRWGVVTYSNIKIYDFQNDKTKKLTSRGRYYSPALNNTASNVVAVHISENNEYNLHIIEVEEPDNVVIVSNSSNFFIQEPQFINDSLIVAMVSKYDGKGMAIFNINKGFIGFVIPLSYQDIRRPQVVDEKIYYTSPYNGIDNIYSVDLNSLAINQHTSSKYGAYNPFLSENRMYYSNLTANGRQLVYSEIDNGFEVDDKRIFDAKLYDKIVEQESGDELAIDSIKDTVFPIKKYSKAANALSLHSYGPVIFTGNQNIAPQPLGIGFQSDNKLNTFSFYGALQYNGLDTFGVNTIGFAYFGWFPTFDFKFTNRGVVSEFYEGQSSNQDTIFTRWKENVYDFNVSIPFNLTDGASITSLVVGVGTQYIKRFKTFQEAPNFIDEIKFPLIYFASFSVIQRPSLRDLAPQLGLRLAFTGRSFEFSDILNGNVNSIISRVFLPGLGKHHSFQLAYNFSKRTSDFIFTTDIPLPRNLGGATGTEISSLLVDYRFPIGYPDAALGSFLYVKRFNLAFLGDYLISGQPTRRTSAIRTINVDKYAVGVELNMDYHLFNFAFPELNTGIQLMFVPNLSNSAIIQATFNVNI
jgi:hypothetical protein